jgi:hypothetical protein
MLDELNKTAVFESFLEKRRFFSPFCVFSAILAAYA